MTEQKLKIELVPATVWFSNLRSLFTSAQWDFIRKTAYKRANYRCEICSGVGDEHPVEAHEEWNYDDENHVITLNKVTALCPACHKVKHIGFAQISGNYESAFHQFKNVNYINDDKAEKLIEKAFKTWEKRSQYHWEIKIENVRKWIEKYVPTPADIQQKINITNELQIEIQKNIEAIAKSLKLNSKQLKTLNFNAITMLNAYKSGRGLEETIENKLQYYSVLNPLMQFIQKYVAENNQDLTKADDINEVYDLSIFVKALYGVNTSDFFETKDELPHLIQDLHTYHIALTEV